MGMLFNHPPLAGLAMAGLLGVSDALSLPFPTALKLATALADMFTCLMVAKTVGSLARSQSLGWWAGSFYSVGLCQVLISGVHANTDSFYVLFLLVSLYCIDVRKAPRCGGLFFALALNVKLIPILLLPALLVVMHQAKQVRQFTSGLFLGVVPIIVAALLYGQPFMKNVLGYTPVPSFLWGLQTLRIFSTDQTQAAFTLSSLSKYAALITSLVGAAIMTQLPKAKAAQALALTSCLFATLSPVFAIQYLALPVALLAVASPRMAILLSSISGLSVLAIYVGPGHTRLWSLATSISNCLLLLAWEVVIVSCYLLSRRSLPEPPEH
jgi:hypothetical protein